MRGQAVPITTTAAASVVPITTAATRGHPEESNSIILELLNYTDCTDQLTRRVTAFPGISHVLDFNYTHMVLLDKSISISLLSVSYQLL